MSAIPAPEELTITLPKELADLVRSQVASGGYSSPVEYLSRAVHNDIVDAILPPVSEGELEHWLKTEVPRLCAEAEAHPEEMLTVDDMYQAIDDEIESIRRKHSSTR